VVKKSSRKSGKAKKAEKPEVRPVLINGTEWKPDKYEASMIRSLWDDGRAQVAVIAAPTEGDDSGLYTVAIDADHTHASREIPVLGGYVRVNFTLTVKVPLNELSETARQLASFASSVILKMQDTPVPDREG